MSRWVGEVLPRVNAVSAPLFDHAEVQELCVATIGPESLFDTHWDAALAQSLRQSAQQISWWLGAPARADVQAVRAVQARTTTG